MHFFKIIIYFIGSLQIKFFSKNPSTDINTNENINSLVFKENKLSILYAQNNLKSAYETLENINFYGTTGLFFTNIIYECIGNVKNELKIYAENVEIENNSICRIYALLYLFKIQSLNLKNCDLISDESGLFFAGFIKNKYLKEIYITNTKMSYNSFRSISGILDHNVTPLEILKIHNDKITSKIFIDICSFVLENKTLKELSIQVEDPIEKFYIIIYNLLKFNHTLRSLEVIYLKSKKYSPKNKMGYEIKPDYNGNKIIIYYKNLSFYKYLLILSSILENKNLNIVEVAFSPKMKIDKSFSIDEMNCFKNEIFEKICENNILLPKTWLKKDLKKRMRKMRKLRKKICKI